MRIEGKRSVVVNKPLSTGTALEHRLTAVCVTALCGFWILDSTLGAVLNDAFIRSLIKIYIFLIELTHPVLLVFIQFLVEFRL